MFVTFSACGSQFAVYIQYTKTSALTAVKQIPSRSNTALAYVQDILVHAMMQQYRKQPLAESPMERLLNDVECRSHAESSRTRACVDGESADEKHADEMREGGRSHVLGR